MFSRTVMGVLWKRGGRTRRLCPDTGPSERPHAVAAYIAASRLKRTVTQTFNRLRPEQEAAFWGDYRFRNINVQRRQLDYVLYRIDQAVDPHKLVNWWIGLELPDFVEKLFKEARQINS